MSLTSTDLRARFADFDRLPADVLGAEVLGALTGRRVLITGATGFVGGWLLAAIAWLNVRAERTIGVVGVSRGSHALDEPWYRHLSLDLRDAGDPPPAFACIHAAMSSEAMPAGGAEEIGETARAGTRWAVAAAAAGARTLVLSSGAVEGSSDAYADAKRDVEREALAAADHGAHVAVARVFTCLGPGYRSHGHLAHVAFFDDAKRGGPIRLTGDGSAVRSYLYGADVAAWLLRGLVLARPGETFAVGNPAPFTLLELARAVAAAAGLPESSVNPGKADAGAVRRRYVPELGEPHTRMRLVAWTPLDVAVTRTLALWPAAPPA